MMLKTLRPYQADLIDEVLREPGHILVQAPTGSGKTLQIVALSHLLLGEQYDRILIAAPQQQIEEGFTNEAGMVRYPHDARVFTLPEIKASRESSLRSRQYIKAFLSSPVGCATACTHQALAFSGAIDLLPDDCRRILLVIDEAHHAPAEGLGSFIDEIERRGGHLHFYSATPWRQDGQRVVRPEMRVIRWSLPQHMADGYAPRHLVHQMRVLGKPGAMSTAAEFRGEKVGPHYETELVEALVAQFYEDGQPKTIIRVPPVAGGSGRLVERIAAAFETRGVRVLDATGVGGQKQATFLAALRDEKARAYEQSQFDVIVGIQRVLEGTDWKHCSAVYCLGMPGGLAMVGQLFGRALRQKDEACPANHRDTARIVFFVPGSGSLQKLSLQHSRNALMTSVFLADFEVGQEWAMAQGINAGISAAFGPDRRARSALRSALTMDEEAKVEATALLLNARHHLQAAGVPEPSLQEVVETATILAERSGSTLTQRQLERAALILAAGRPGPRGKRIRDAAKERAEQEAIDWAKATEVKDDPHFGALLNAVFEKLRDDFRDETLEGSAVLELVGTQLHKLTGGHMVDFMERMRNAFPKVITHKMIVQWLGNHFGDGRRPKHLPQLSATVPGTERFKGGYPLTWGEVERALLRGEHGLPGNECIAEIVCRHLGFTCDCRKALDPTKVHVSDGPTPTFIEYHIRKTGCFPVPSDDPIPFTDLTWSMLHKTVLHFRNSMGLELPPRGDHLAMPYYFLSMHIGVLLDQWVKSHELVPTAQSGIIPDVGGLTWKNAEDYVRHHSFGFLKRMMEFADGMKWPESKLRRLSGEEGLRSYWIFSHIYYWVNRWVRATGSPPESDSGVIPESGGVCWAEIDDMLRRFHRLAYPNGLPRTGVLEEQKDILPYAYSSLEDRIAHFQVVKKANGVAIGDVGDGDFGPQA